MKKWLLIFASLICLALPGKILAETRAAGEEIMAEAGEEASEEAAAAVSEPEEDLLWQPIYTPKLLPDSPFYFLKRVKERLELAFANSVEKKVAKRAEIATRRLAELKALEEKDSSLVEEHVQPYLDQLALLEEDMAGLEGEKVDWLKEHVGEVTLKHQSVLLDVYEKVPETAKKGIENALENSLRGHQQVMESLPQEKQERLEEKVADKTEEILKKLERAEEKWGTESEEGEGQGEGEPVLERVRTQLQEEIQNQGEEPGSLGEEVKEQVQEKGQNKFGQEE